MIASPVLISIHLEGFPPTPNETRRRNYHVNSDDAARWRHAAKMVALQALRESPHPEDFPLTRATVELVVLRPDGKGPDLDNAIGACKPCIDGIVDAGVLAGDGRRHLVGLSVRYETGPVGLRVDVLMGHAAA